MTSLALSGENPPSTGSSPSPISHPLCPPTSTPLICQTSLPNPTLTLTTPTTLLTSPTSLLNSNQNQTELLKQTREEETEEVTSKGDKESTVLQASCSVCSAPAAIHLHYGAISCYSCRAFFRRGTPKQARCIFGSGDCKITPHNRTNCKLCRYKRCVETGMKPEKVDAYLMKRKEREARLAASGIMEPNRSPASEASERVAISEEQIKIERKKKEKEIRKLMKEEEKERKKAMELKPANFSSSTSSFASTSPFSSSSSFSPMDEDPQNAMSSSRSTAVPVNYINIKKNAAKYERLESVSMEATQNEAIMGTSSTPRAGISAELCTLGSSPESRGATSKLVRVDSSVRHCKSLQYADSSQDFADSQTHKPMEYNSVNVSGVQYSTVQNSTVQCSTVQYRPTPVICRPPSIEAKTDLRQFDSPHRKSIEEFQDSFQASHKTKPYIHTTSVCQDNSYKQLSPQECSQQPSSPSCSNPRSYPAQLSPRNNTNLKPTTLHKSPHPRGSLPPHYPTPLSPSSPLSYPSQHLSSSPNLLALLRPPQEPYNDPPSPKNSSPSQSLLTITTSQPNPPSLQSPSSNQFTIQRPSPTQTSFTSPSPNQTEIPISSSPNIVIIPYCSSPSQLTITPGSPDSMPSPSPTNLSNVVGYPNSVSPQPQPSPYNMLPTPPRDLYRAPSPLPSQSSPAGKARNSCFPPSRQHSVRNSVICQGKDLTRRPRHALADFSSTARVPAPGIPAPGIPAPVLTSAFSSYNPRSLLYQNYNRDKATFESIFPNMRIQQQRDLYHQQMKNWEEDRLQEVKQEDGQEDVTLELMTSVPDSYEEETHLKSKRKFLTKVKLSDLEEEEEEEEVLVRTVTNTNVPLKKRARMMEVPYAIGHVINSGVIPVMPFTFEEEFQVIDYIVRIEQYQNKRFEFLQKSFEKYRELTVAFVACTAMGKKIPFNSELEKKLFAMGLDFTKQNTTEVYEEMGTLSTRTRRGMLNSTYPALYVVMFSILEGNTSEATWIDQHKKTVHITKENHQALQGYIKGLENVRAISLKDQERFTSPWAVEMADEEKFERTVGILGRLLRDDMQLQAMYHMLVMMTPSPKADPDVQADPLLIRIQVKLCQLIYRYLSSTSLETVSQSPSSSSDDERGSSIIKLARPEESSGLSPDEKTRLLISLIDDLHDCAEIMQCRSLCLDG